MNAVTYNINVTGNGIAQLNSVENSLTNINGSVNTVTKSFGDCFKGLLSVQLVSQSLETLKQGLDSVSAPGIALNTQMADLAAITGLTGSALDKISDAARQSAKVFGTSATANVESYKLLLSQLSPEIANNAEAMKVMGDNVNILSKTMGGDTVAATNVLTTAMNQYGVSLDDPIAASKIMAEMMNVMAEAARTQGMGSLRL